MAQAGAVRRAGGRMSRAVLASVLHGVLVLVPLAAYLVYEDAHGARVQAAYYRTLASAAAELIQRLDHLRHLFTYAGRASAEGSDAWLARAQVEDLPPGPLPDRPPADARCDAAPIALALTPGPGGAQVQLDRSGCAAYALWCGCPSADQGTAPPVCAVPAGAGTVAAFDRALGAELARYGRAGFAIAPGDAAALHAGGRCAQPAARAGALTPASVAAALGGGRTLRVPLADLLPGRARFRSMLLLTEDGAVVQASTPGWPGRIVLPPGAADASAGPGRLWPRAQQARRGALPALYAAPVLVERAGTTQALLCTPVALPYAQAPALALCGAVEQAVLAREARSLPPDLLALVVLLFLLSVCAVPLLKVWLIGPREAFWRADLFAAVVAVISAAALLTVLVGWAGHSLAWRSRLDAVAQDTAGEVTRAFAHELADSAAWLERLSAPGARPEALAPALPRWGRLAFRLDARGDQVGELGTGAGIGRLAAPARVGNRAYFRAALDGPRLPVGAVAAGVEQVVMRGHGVKATALAAPLRDRAGAAVLIRTFESLEAPVLPPGFALVVFEAGTGRVVFHSDAERALSEGFYDELDAPALRAHVGAGRAALVGGEYAGAPYRFHVRPLHAGWPWWVAVGREERLWRAAGFDLVAGALPATGFLLAALGAAVLTLAWAVLRARRARPASLLGWLWPQWGLNYTRRAALLAALAGVGVVACLALSPRQALVAVTLLVLAGAAVLIETARATHRAAAEDATSTARGYLAALAAALVLVGVLPAAAVVRDLAAWLDAGYQREVLRTYRAAPAPAGAEPVPGWYLPDSVVGLRPLGGAPVPVSAANPCLRSPGACVLVAGAAPDLADTHVEALRAAARDVLADERAIGARRCLPLAGDAALLVCAARSPGLWPHGRAGFALAALALALAFLAFRLLRGAAYRLFGFDIEAARPADGEGADFPARGHVLVVRSAPGYAARLVRQLAREIPAPRVRRVDMRAAEVDEHGKPRWPAALSAHHEVVILEEFDAGARDPQWGAARLALLERLVFRPEPRVVVLTDVSDPSRLALEAAAHDTRDALAARWADVLRECVLVRYPPPAPDGGAREPALHVLAQETGWWWRLMPLADTLSARRGFADLSAHAARAEVVAHAWPEYRRLWGLCTQAERLVLAQLAHGGQLNPRQGAVVGQLLRRGLVCRGPEFRLAGEGFALYVRSEVDRALLADWERADAGGAWSSWRAPLLVAVLVGGALVFVTQRDTFQAAYALSAAGLAALPALARVLGGLRTGVRTLGRPDAQES